MKNEKEKLETEAAFQKKQLDSMEEIMSVLDRVGEENTLGTLTLDSLAQYFRDLPNPSSGMFIVHLYFKCCLFVFVLIQ